MTKCSACQWVVIAVTAFAAMALFPARAEEPASAGGGPTMLSSAFSPENLAKARLADFEAALDAASQTQDFVGLAVAVVRGGEIVMLKTYGVAEAGGRAPVTPNTVFRVGSLSKGFASTLTGLAIEEGRVSLDAPVASYARRFALRGGAQSRLTIEDILTHRVGLPPNAYDNLLEDGLELSEILPRFRRVKPICAIGTCYAYQNITYNLIADVLSDIYGAPYEELVRERIFAPLAMHEASFGPDGLVATGDWARPHVRERLFESDSDSGAGVSGAAFGPWRAVPVKDSYYKTPAAGGVNASITDMARWLAAQMGAAPEVLPAGVLARIHAPLVETPVELRRWPGLAGRLNGAQYALGWRVYDYNGATLINHSGTVEGYGAQIAWLPEENVGIVILSNTRAERVWRILPAFLDIELGLGERDWFGLEEGAKPLSASLSANNGE